MVSTFYIIFVSDRLHPSNSSELDCARFVLPLYPIGGTAPYRYKGTANRRYGKIIYRKFRLL